MDAYKGGGMTTRAEPLAAQERDHFVHSDKMIGIGTGVGFERVRRITGYCVASLSRWNSAKLAELKDRVRHYPNTH